MFAIHYLRHYAYSTFTVLRILPFILLLSWIIPSWADETPPDDTVASPYFVIDGAADGNRMPLKNTKVDAHIAGVIADVFVTQHYRNEGETPIEARYVFPGSTRAAVYAMKIKIGERRVIAEIHEKKKARNQYETAKREGKTAALLEQHRPNVFQMNVANIMPGEDVWVELKYTELLSPTDGEYQFVFPTVVGPRYVGAGQQDGRAPETWTASPFLPEGVESAAGFELNVNLAAPMKIQDIRSATHRIERTWISEKEERVVLERGKNVANRDFILNYRLSGDTIQSGILMSKNDGGENYFVALAEPPRRNGKDDIVPRDYVFVVDVSGSMRGFPLNTAKTLLRELIGGLRTTDTFNVLLFSGDNRMLSPQSLPATAENIESALRIIDEEGGGGGTELIPALKTALAQPADERRSRSFIVVTDGYVSVEREAYALVRKNLSRANLFAFGIGGAVNRELIEGLARAGQGEPFIVTDAAAAKKEAGRLRTMIEAPLLMHLRYRFDGLDAYDIEPQALPDVFAQRPVILFGKWRGPARGKLMLDGETAAGTYHAGLEITEDLPRSENAALGQLWARHRIANLSDQEKLEGNEAYAEEITKLGLRYSLLTQYTSFVAIDKTISNPNAENIKTIDQASPLPQGVSNAAVGGGYVSSTPEPRFWMLLLVALAALLAMPRLIGRNGMRVERKIPAP